MSSAPGVQPPIQPAPMPVEPTLTPLPSPPRPFTPRVRWRSWGALSVRPWLILFVAVAFVTAFFLITRLNEALSSRWLIQNGMDVTARVLSVNGDVTSHRRFRNEPMAVSLSLIYQGKPFTLDIPRLEPKPDAYVTPGEEFHIKIDPKDPTHWTEETRTRPWSQELTVVGLLLPLLIVIGAVVWLKRRGVLNLWRDGAAVQVQVVELRLTAAAPRSRLVRFVLPDADDRRVYSLLWPASAGAISAGDAITIIHRPDRPGTSIPAKLYEGGSQ